VRVCGSLSERAHEICSSDAIARGLDLAIARKARVVSMSLAGPYDPLVARLVYRASEGGIVLVAATGNDGLATVKYPAALEPVLAVTAIDREERLYEKANRGARVDLAAPGVDVFTLASPQLFGPTTGTSPAAAQVSGVVALLLQLRPDFSPAQVRQLLEETARDLGPPGRDEQFGSGAVDVCRAVSKLTSDPTPCR
jgi:subtilisin family serine protease